ncbi:MULTISPECIES: Asp23/Gls24 family envelope stress response protein [unclassified Cryobacterium]|uniref:Asp23/Gls24 family envelope stress response protein n=1 Tax=unclassified Cryobacterium TaxID=2649013 RepID=UPI00106D43FE|nr:MULTISPECIES: Asp23/Gls24 family envelope stress response protein [unclassified Cryobacterium]TFC51761.1 Asp23/Gls24 family envelope stress response protein [Cryobacterium sp. TMB3-1-2]TFC68887.1 Asp23/Gls24 family envelope stress response protein [Cryobacterium sp. TMB3-15]TFC72259.1 Asp23/Gls24 family envelope stress response protein [Cryobacterium sp. TMB3-10]TFD38510.1 Asp23/Gls24 family envelope stress response protein [Cryobacterium sp. TMB3-12]
MFSSTPEQPTSATTLPANAGEVTDGAVDRAGQGVTTIKDSVIAKVAGLAVREVPGVHSLGSVPTRALGAILDAISSADVNPGISVTVSDDDVAVEIVLVADYPVPLTALADQVRAATTRAIEGLVGIAVSTVNVTITDIYVAKGPEDNDVA